MESISFIFTPISAIFVLVPLVIVAITLLVLFKKSDTNEVPLVVNVPTPPATPVTTPIAEPVASVAVPVAATVHSEAVPEVTAPVEAPAVASWKPAMPTQEEVPAVPVSDPATTIVSESIVETKVQGGQVVAIPTQEVVSQVDEVKVEAPVVA